MKTIVVHNYTLGLALALMITAVFMAFLSVNDSLYANKTFKNVNARGQVIIGDSVIPSQRTHHLLPGYDGNVGIGMAFKGNTTPDQYFYLEVSPSDWLCDDDNYTRPEAFNFSDKLGYEYFTHNKDKNYLAPNDGGRNGYDGTGNQILDGQGGFTQFFSYKNDLLRARLDGTTSHPVTATRVITFPVLGECTRISATFQAAIYFLSSGASIVDSNDNLIADSVYDIVLAPVMTVEFYVGNDTEVTNFAPVASFTSAATFGEVETNFRTHGQDTFVHAGEEGANSLWMVSYMTAPLYAGGFLSTNEEAVPVEISDIRLGLQFNACYEKAKKTQDMSCIIL